MILWMLGYYCYKVINTFEVLIGVRLMTIVFVYFKFIVCVCLLGERQLSVVSNSGLLDRLVAEVTKGDILVQLNALEMLTPLALNPSGMSLLDSGGVIAKLQYLLSLAETDPMAALLMPGLLSVSMFWSTLFFLSISPESDA